MSGSSTHFNQSWVTNWVFGSPDTCTYCGAAREEIDHVIPVSWFCQPGKGGRGRKRRSHQARNSGIRTYTCRACNSCLGNRFFETFRERCEHVENSYRNGYGGVASLDAWEKEELDELSGKLRDYIEYKQAQREEITRRAEYPFSDGFYANIQDIASQPILDTQSSRFNQTCFDYFESELVQILTLFYTN